MEQNQQKRNESNYSESDSTVIDGKKTIILLRTEAKKNVDQTISTPERYLSRYQYNTRNIDKYLQLCPHCKKPTLSAFDRSVIDSAIDYLNGKRMFENFPRREFKFFPNVFFISAFAVIVYFIVNHF